MCICEDCKISFDEPNRATHMETIDGFVTKYVEETCPHCGSQYFVDADICQCGQEKRKDEILCESCRYKLKVKFMAFADELTADEENQMDEWLDGCSILERRKWV